jgi:predicted secreted hydrolase
MGNAKAGVAPSPRRGRSVAPSPRRGGLGRGESVEHKPSAPDDFTSSCAPRIGLQADAVQQAQRMRLESPASPPTLLRQGGGSVHRRLLLAAGAGLFNPSQAAQSPQGITPRPLTFPSDHGAHPDTRTEWWYVTGTLQSGPDNFGFQITFFRSKTNVAPDHPSRFAASQLHFAHVALTDLQAKKMQHDQRIARGGFGRASAAEGDTNLVLEGWTLKRVGDITLPTYQTKINTVNFAFDLSLTAAQPLLLQGAAGYSRKGPQPEQASHYYSIPQLQVSGQLTRQLTQQRKAVAVTGRAWLDHEWSNTVLDREAVGWDWIGMNLNNGGALTAFRLRRADGSALYAGGSFRSADGRLSIFKPDEVRFTPGRTWRSASSKANYPVAWTVDTPAGRFKVQSLLDNQELDGNSSTGSVYWEGLSELLDASNPTSDQVIGRGYLEMTGYAGALTL